MKNSPVGFMQGRLSPVANGKIQEFPWDNWQNEFVTASNLGFCSMEWTLDQEKLSKNPLMTKQGRAEIKELSKNFGIKVPSLTGDCFMQAPFWKLFGKDGENRKEDLISILDACFELGVALIVIPLVDEGRIENKDQENALLDFLHEKENIISNKGIQILFESDFDPKRLKAFIGKFNSEIFGINYDIGNSAALGFDVEEEFAAYGDRVINIHVKDRVLNGNTVPLGDGNADFNSVFKNLNSIGYQGNYILQTARSKSGDHSGVLIEYKRIIETLINNSGTTTTK